VHNPAPHRRVTGIEMLLRFIYKVPEPALECFFDTERATVTLEPVPGPHVARLRIAPGATQEPAPLLQTLRIDSLHTASPAQDGSGNDRRLLSIAVAEISFFYQT